MRLGISYPASTERDSVAAGLWVGDWLEVQILFNRMIFVQLSWRIEVKLSKNTGIPWKCKVIFKTAINWRLQSLPYHVLLDSDIDDITLRALIHKLPIRLRASL